MKAAVSKEDAKAILRRTFEELWNKGNLDLADELYTPDYVGHDPATAGDLGTGPERVKNLVNFYRGAFGDLTFTIEDLVAEGDRVVARWTSKGTHSGEFNGVPPTGNIGSPTGITIARFENGKIAEEWINWDALGLLRQLGLLPGQ